MSNHNCQTGSRTARCLSEANAVPGASAFHTRPFFILLKIGRGKGKQPAEHPALHPGARHCNPGPNPRFMAMIYSKGGSGHPLQSQSVSLFPEHCCVHEVHSSLAPLTLLIFTYTIISCRLIVQAFSFVLVKINFLETCSASKAF